MSSESSAPPTLFNPAPVTGFINVIWDGKPHVVRANDARWLKAVELYKAADWQGFVNLSNTELLVSQAVADYGDVSVVHGAIYYQGYQVHNLVTERILQLLDHGMDVEPSIRFLDKLMKNPSKRAVDELYTFLEHKNMPLTSNGNFLAYKGVKSDYSDVYTGQFDNSVGQVREMPRNRVDDDKDVGCSQGFHAGSLDYAAGYMPDDGHLMVVEIDPADVVSVPLDCDCQKLRTCRYKVVDEYKDALTHPVYLSRFVTENDWIEEYQEDEEEEEFTCPDCGGGSTICISCDLCEDCCDC